MIVIVILVYIDLENALWQTPFMNSVIISMVGILSIAMTSIYIWKIDVYICVNHSANSIYNQSLEWYMNSQIPCNNSVAL